MIVSVTLPAAAAATPTIAGEIGLDGVAPAGTDAPAPGNPAPVVPAAPVAEGVAADASAMPSPPAFEAVVATTSAPASTVALVSQPARPMQVGTHAPQTPGLGGAFLALVLVLGLILGLAWLLKRLPGGGFRQADGLRVVASIPLGGKERAAVVQVGGEQLLLGIGAGGVRTLHVLPAALPEAAPVQLPSLKSLPDFKQLLAQRLRKDT